MNQYLKSLWLTETVRLIEKDRGHFRDDEANRQARAINANIADRIMLRAAILSEQHGLKSSQQEWLSCAKWSLIILLLIALFIGAGLAFSALAHNPVNLYWALLCLLGVHFVTLCLWLITCLFLPNESGSFLIHIWLWLAKKLAKKSTVSQVLPAFISLFNKQLRWLVGLIVNLLWSVILCSALLILVILLSTKHYTFEWQTTLLSAEAIVTLTHFLGELPALIGFALPDNATIRASEQAMVSGEIRSAWAVWLLGIFIVYGIALRLLLLLFCWLKWLTGCQTLALNMHYPEYQLLINELATPGTKQVIDKEQSASRFAKQIAAPAYSVGSDNILVAIDIPTDWLPPLPIGFLGFLNNSEQRTAMLDFLQHNPVAKLLIAIDTDRLPDRGMLNLIKSLAIKSAECKLWFINQGRQLHNWQASLTRLNMQTADIAWLNAGEENAN